MLSAVPTLAQRYLQIVNLKANHWVTLSNLRFQSSAVVWILTPPRRWTHRSACLYGESKAEGAETGQVTRDNALEGCLKGTGFPIVSLKSMSPFYCLFVRHSTDPCFVFAPTVTTERSKPAAALPCLPLLLRRPSQQSDVDGRDFSYCRRRTVNRL
ncbi:hypothetical protein J4Q44_G00371120 [Coregonus suidteri]|uniref:Uncharacterized protein n=1 Tax=Coregonus suidteri TaxID=861788 RepID=A0AAN8KKQ0_9TELE